MSEERDARLGRRRLLRAGAGAVGAGLVGAGATGTALAQSEPFGGWMSDVGNYEGLVDGTGADQITVDVGAEANQGSFGFGPPAVQVDPGTTVVWEWTGQGGQHNVVAEEGASFESDLSAEEGFTFEQTFEEEGVIKYYCLPHRAMGMKGVVVVGDIDTGAEVIEGDVGGSGGSGGGEGGSGDSGGLGDGGIVMSLLIAGSLVAAFLSPVVFGIVMMLKDVGGKPGDAGAEHGDAGHGEASHDD
ncbi:halocyanin domain-containing protein [Haloplanus halobius]|uniref:halocyanin domain-containing protein n=1 Tax=Haloplanus halobius TaxID=2934938 RepID=UPI00200E0D54|nr:halocyanin domain-containing protein [Haloplanus sp. XH21]